jgi:hypothetical protein
MGDKTMTDTKVTDFEIVDLGVEFPDYFQGFGTSFTDYAHAVVGIGYTLSEAYDDALEQIACEYDSNIIPEFDDSELVNDYYEIEDSNAYYEIEEQDEEREYPYIHVGIRFNVA